HVVAEQAYRGAPWTARGPSQVAGCDLCGPAFFASVSFSKEMLKYISLPAANAPTRRVCTFSKEMLKQTKRRCLF
ncbi:MAG: hypothetical protein J5809_02250, partial [Selenomonadaceae bacterium]|nr:hypothetical protein [Selenomonadaceae bacterium]